MSRIFASDRELPLYFEPVEVGKHDVEHDERRAECPYRFEGVAACGCGLDLEPFVAVKHVDGKQSGNVGSVHGAATIKARSSLHSNMDGLAITIGYSIYKVEILWIPLLAEQVNFIPQPDERARKVGVVDI